MAFLPLHWQLPVHPEHLESSLTLGSSWCSVPPAKSLNKANHIPDTYGGGGQEKLGVYSHYTGMCSGAQEILNACYSLGTTRIGLLLTLNPPILSHIHAINIYQRLLTWHLDRHDG